MTGYLNVENLPWGHNSNFCIIPFTTRQYMYSHSLALFRSQFLIESFKLVITNTNNILWATSLKADFRLEEISLKKSIISINLFFSKAICLLSMDVIASWYFLLYFWQECIFILPYIISIFTHSFNTFPINSKAVPTRHPQLPLSKDEFTLATMFNGTVLRLY